MSSITSALLQLNMGYKINLVNGFRGRPQQCRRRDLHGKVTDANGCSGQNTAVINQPSQIQVNSFSPTSGLSGTSVTILGSGFLGVIDVQFNGISAATFTVDNFSKSPQKFQPGRVMGQSP